MRTAALHGDFATPKMLQRDMGDPRWIDLYIERQSVESMASLCSAWGVKNLVGYSRGGYLACKIAELIPIKTLVLYESPMFDAQPQVLNAVVVFNSVPRRRKRRSREMSRVLRYFSGHMTFFHGAKKRHLEAKPYWPFLGHAWDQSLNDLIAGELR